MTVIINIIVGFVYWYKFLRSSVQRFFLEIAKIRALAKFYL